MTLSLHSFARLDKQLIPIQRLRDHFLPDKESRYEP